VMSKMSSMMPSRRSSGLLLHRTTSKNGNTGFEDLKNFIKDGGDFAKEVATILEERAELEAVYSKGVSKLAAKLFKASKENTGTISNAWHFVANDFEQTAEVHKTVAAAVLEEIAKPLKVFGEIQHKARKATEALVEKRHKQLQDWRSTEAKAKAKSYAATKDNEKCQDQLLDCKLGRGRQLSDKEQIKLQAKRKKSETAVRKSDMEYYAACIKTERSRLDWEGAVKRGAKVFRRLEEERLGQLQAMAALYLQVMENNRPKLVSLSSRLREPIALCDTAKDLSEVRLEVEGEEVGGQILPHFYCEDMMNVMNKERRREALSKFVGIIKADIERERKGRAGVENLAKALQETPKFGGEESQADVQDKLQHMRSMMTYLEASRYKALNVMMDVEGRPRVVHTVSSYIDYSKDKQGFTQASLRLPSWVKVDPLPPTPESDLLPAGLDWSDRGTADGGSPSDSQVGGNSPRMKTSMGVAEDISPFFTTTNPIHTPPSRRDLDIPLYRGVGDGGHPSDEEEKDKSRLNGSISTDKESSRDWDGDEVDGPDSDFDDFESGDDDTEGRESSRQDEREEEERRNEEQSMSLSTSRNNEIEEIYYQEKQVAVIGQCRAIYDYVANMYDELSISYGDVINIHDKQEDDWWLGECGGKVGIFPATYVEQI